MKQRTQFSLIAAGLMAAGLMASGVTNAADDASADVSATVVAPIAIVKNADLSFGNITQDNGTVTVSTKGERTKSVAGAAFPGIAGTITAAKFTVTGAGANTFSISTDGSSSTLSGPDEASMAISYLIEAQSGTTAAGGITDTEENDDEGTLSEGTATIYAGGILTVGATQAAGAYTGTLKVTVDYN